MNKMLGSGIIFSSTVLYALTSVLIKKGNKGVPTFFTIAVSMFVLFMISFVTSLFYEKSYQLNWTEIKTSVFFLVVAGVVNFFGFWLAIMGYKYLPLWQQSMFALLTPALTGLFAYFLLGEQVSIKLLFGLLIMGLGLFITVR